MSTEGTRENVGFTCINTHELQMMLARHEISRAQWVLILEFGLTMGHHCTHRVPAARSEIVKAGGGLLNESQILTALEGLERSNIMRTVRSGEEHWIEFVDYDRFVQNEDEWNDSECPKL